MGIRSGGYTCPGQGGVLRSGTGNSQSGTQEGVVGVPSAERGCRLSITRNGHVRRQQWGPYSSPQTLAFLTGLLPEAGKPSALQPQTSGPGAEPRSPLSSAGAPSSAWWGASLPLGLAVCVVLPLPCPLSRKSSPVCRENVSAPLGQRARAAL